MRGWNFEGSVDKETWTALREHKDDESITYSNTLVTFDIDECDNYYRYFRIYSTQRQHHGWWEITASLLEIYGYTIRDYSQTTDETDDDGDEDMEEEEDESWGW